MNSPLRHVLVVDDDLEAATSLANILQRWFHCQVHVVSDGADAIDMAVQHHPEAVVLKADLPGVTGAEVALVLRRLFRRSPPRLIAISSAEASRVRWRGVFDAWLGDPPDLRALMTELIDSREEAPEPARNAATTARA